MKFTPACEITPEVQDYLEKLLDKLPVKNKVRQWYIMGVPDGPPGDTIVWLRSLELMDGTWANWNKIRGKLFEAFGATYHYAKTSPPANPTWKAYSAYKRQRGNEMMLHPHNLEIDSGVVVAGKPLDVVIRLDRPDYTHPLCRREHKLARAWLEREFDIGMPFSIKARNQSSGRFTLSYCQGAPEDVVAWHTAEVAVSPDYEHYGRFFAHLRRVLIEKMVTDAPVEWLKDVLNRV